MRYLHSDTKCPVCKTANDTLIVDTDNLDLSMTDADDGSEVHHKTFAQYERWGNSIGNGFAFRDDVGMFFPTKVYEGQVLPLLGYGCGLPHCVFTNASDTFVTEKEMGEEKAHDTTIGGGSNKGQQKASGKREAKKRLTGLKALKTHLRTDHGYALCELCVENKRDFVSKLARYTPQGLKVHQSKGDGERSGFAGHPLCEFCRPRRFYDIVKLHEHLNKEHYKCHICDRAGRPNQFFKDYPRLERHFDREHYLCHDRQCLAARFVVFENEIDLRGHERSVHGTNRRDGGTKIQLEFRVRREGEALEQSVPSGEDFQFGLNGEAFVPDALPGEEDGFQRQANEPEISHPLHAARTAELRAQAARVRERDGLASGTGSGGAEEAFPSLGAESSDAAASGGGMLIGWSGDGLRNAAAGGRVLTRVPVGKVTEEEFPSLGPGPSTASSRNRKLAQKLSVGRRKPSATTQSRGPNFAALASRPATSASGPIASVVSYASSLPAASAPDMTRDNFPSLGVGKPRPTPSYPKPSAAALPRAAPNLNNAKNFPSLGGAGGPKIAQQPNPYAAAQAHARRLNAGKGSSKNQSQRPTTGPGSAPGASSAHPALSSASDFPPPPSSASAKKSTATAAFAPKKPPPMDNVLQFPPPSSAASEPSPRSLRAGKQTVASLKQTLGTARYKKLKARTREFAMGDAAPEAYIDGAAALFDRGIADEAFWAHIPSLIRDIPNKGAVDRALRHLETLRVANQMQELEFGGLEFGGRAQKSTKPIIYVLPSKKKGSSWGTGNASAASKLGASGLAEASQPDATGNNAAKKAGRKKNENATGGKGKKSKANKRNNELRELAFGT
ncbi:hypothetical protein ACHAXT_007695 [Thalassiosira profunda]